MPDGGGLVAMPLLVLRNVDRNGVGLGPVRLPVDDLNAVHRYLHGVVRHLAKQVVIVDGGALEQVTRGAYDGIGVRSSSPGHEIGYSSMLVTFVIVNVAAEDYEAGPAGPLLVLQERRQGMLGRACRVPIAEDASVG